jgi:hypothetical protein
MSLSSHSTHSPPCQLDALVALRAALRPCQHDLVGQPLRNRPRRILARVVHDDEFDGRMGLAADRGQARLDRALVVAGRYDDAHQGIVMELGHR